MAGALRQQIEATLAGHPYIGQALVVDGAGNWGQNLVAYMVPASGRVIDINEIRQYLGHRLSDTAAVSGFVVLDALPLTPGGEVDCAALPTPPTLKPDHTVAARAQSPSGEGRRGGARRRPLIQELFEEQAAQTPTRTAVRGGGLQLTYAELNERANRLAHFLIKAGVGLEDRVGVCLERSPEVLVALLGIFKSGGVYVPLDPGYPAERLKYMMADARVRVLLADRAGAARLAQGAPVTVCLADEWGRIEQEAADNPGRLARGENLAYLIYTSGSTGNPKGVMVEHGGLANLIADSRERFGFTEFDVMPCLASFSFDISLFELCNPLCAGGAVEVWDQKDVLDIRLLIDSFERLTLLHCVPTLMRQVVTQMKEDGRGAGRIRHVFVGGEAVGAQLLEQMREVFHGAGVHVLYGPTEGTIICASRPVTGEVTAAPIGKAIGNAGLYVLDPELKRTPAGAVGELYLGGAGLARGYLNRPDLTAERFVPHCFSEEEGGRLYRTGDLVRWHEDGNLEFVSRSDQQVKIRGHRVELGEVESALTRCPGVSEAAVLVREDQPGQKRLVAYVLTDKAGARAHASSPEVPCFSPAVHDYVYDLTPLTPRRETDPGAHPFHRAISENVRDKTVMLVGTSRGKLLLRACVAGGAKRVYVAEGSEEAYGDTLRFVEAGNFEQVVPFRLGGEVPRGEQRIDICVSEAFGDIGGSKGLETWLGQLRTALDPETIVYPQSCITYLSAVELPEALRAQSLFHGTAVEEARRIFAAEGYPFDLRVRVHNLPRESVISGESVFEQIVFADPQFDGAGAAEQQIQLTISRKALLCGFTLTLKLSGDMNGRGRAGCCYAADAPVFVPVFMPGVEVEAGDRIEGRCVRRPSAEARPHVDYQLEGRILFRSGAMRRFFYRLPFIQRVFEGGPFYKNLFSATPLEELLSVARPDDREAVRGLWDRLKAELPDYMLPSAIVKMEEFPVTPNGKIDRRALPAPEYGSGPGGARPTGPLQEALCTLFADVLGVPQVSPDDTFFDLGGDSIMSIQLVKRIGETLGVNLAIRTFYEAPTVAGVAERLQRMWA